MHLLEVNNVKKSYGKNLILKDISFTVDAGEWIILVGDNGCGKSTLLQIIAGAMKADAGTILPDTRMRKNYGFVPQDNPLFGELSVMENIKFFIGKDKKKQQQVISQFGLDTLLKQRVDTLSGGQKRRLSIACCLAGMPPMIILDEPTTALDFHYQKLIDDMLREYVNTGGSIVMTSHNSDELKEATKILRMKAGMLET